MQGVFVGIVSDIVLTPIILALQTLGLIAGIPVMICYEIDERKKIHR